MIKTLNEKISVLCLKQNKYIDIGDDEKINKYNKKSDMYCDMRDAMMKCVELIKNCGIYENNYSLSPIIINSNSKEKYFDSENYKSNSEDEYYKSNDYNEF
jgi:hypothetical protein